MKKLFLITLFFLLWSSIALAGEVTLAWTESKSPDVVEYRVYQSMLPRQHALGNGNHVASVAGSTFKVIILNVPPGRYYWVVTAINTAALESLPSNEVGATVGATDHNAQNSGMDYYIITLEGPPLLTIIQIG